MDGSEDEDFTARLLEVISRSAGRQIGKDLYSLDPDENLFDLGMTSIGFISMIVELENSFGIIFDEDDLHLRHYSCIRAIRSKLASKVAEG